jgi:hypothetical protein
MPSVLTSQGKDRVRPRKNATITIHEDTQEIRISIRANRNAKNIRVRGRRTFLLRKKRKH